MLGRLLPLAMFVLTGSALAQDKPAPKVEISAPVFEMFRLVPGQTG